ncbi:MAG: ChbG/HpnK family deacetylase, partial [Phycisphaerae bacterium]|nr:ChbG/HpnK family deacetylase [Phycisphaerae bacterium]
QGGLTSATIMPRMPCTARAVEFARSNPRFGFGVHLTYVCEGDATPERPVLAPDQVRSLVRSDGRFLPSNETRKLALRGRLDVDQIASETEAQIRLLLDAGVAVTHVDSHGHLHKFGPFREALRRVLPRFGITRVRGVQDVYLRRPLKSFTYWFGPVWRRRIRAAFSTADAFYMPSSAGDMDWPGPLLKRLEALGVNTVEVGVHPGAAETWRQREFEGAVSLGELARRAGHELVTYRDV